MFAQPKVIPYDEVPARYFKTLKAIWKCVGLGVANCCVRIQVANARSGLVQTVAYNKPPTNSLYGPEKIGSVSAVANFSYKFALIGVVGKYCCSLGFKNLCINFST